MNKKLIISEAQLGLIANHVNSEQLLEEGFKDIALGLLMLAGVTLTGQNKAIAQDALSNTEIVQKINTTLSDTASLDALIDRIDEKMPNAGDIIRNNADAIKANIQYIEDKDLDQYTKTVRTTSPSNIRSHLKQGYAISNIEIKRDTVLPPKSIMTIQDTIDYNWSSDNFFMTAGSELSPSAMDSIAQVVGDIKVAGGTIIGVYIEASTDKEPIKMGNDQLALMRADAVEDFMRSLDLGEPQFNVQTKPDNGPDLYSQPLSRGARVAARIKTAPYRYVKVRLIVVFEEEVIIGETAPQVIERHIVELVKVDANSSKTVKIKYQTGRKTKCKKVKETKDDGTVIPLDCHFIDPK